MKPAPSRSFWAFGTGFNEGAVIYHPPDGSPPAYEFFKGKRLARKFPAKATVRFADSFPKFIKVFDVVTSVFGVPIVSGKVRAILEELAEKDHEFLPMTLLDHKGKVASKEHFLLNPLRIEDVVDMQRSKYDRDRFEPDQIRRLMELHMKPAAVPDDVHLFRAKTKLDQIFIDDAVNDAFEKAKVTGLRLFPAEGWDGNDM